MTTFCRVFIHSHPIDWSGTLCEGARGHEFVLWRQVIPEILELFLNAVQSFHLHPVRELPWSTCSPPEGKTCVTGIRRSVKSWDWNGGGDYELLRAGLTINFRLAIESSMAFQA